MESMSSQTHPPPSSTPGTLHFIPPNLSAFEPAKPLLHTADLNTLLWIGGLFDTPLSVSYPLALAQALGPTWTLAAASLASAGLSWGVGSIAQDAEDVARIVAHLRALRPAGRLVLMGHSTGCQDCVEYVAGAGAAGRPPVHGVVLQAPVSDREALGMLLPAPHLREANQLALAMCREGRGAEALPPRLVRPAFGPVAVTARRWVDLASPPPLHAGADDFFSSDLPDERLAATFGRLPARVPLLVLVGGADESVPTAIDKEALVRRWVGAVKRGGGQVDEVYGGVVPGASHNLNGCPEEVVQDVIRRVLGFIQRIDTEDLEG